MSDGLPAAHHRSVRRQENRMTDVTLTPRQSDVSPQPSRRWLERARLGWLGLAVFLFAVFVISIPGTYRMLQCVPDDPDCPSWAYLTPDVIAALERSGISLQANALI